MPKRIIDGERLWGSDKLSTVTPESFRPEYANLLPLAMANGVFECDPMHVWSRVYSFNRPSWTVSKVKSLLDEFEKRKLLFRWTTAEGKSWGFWIGIDKPGRLPAQCRNGHEPRGPEPPKSELLAFCSYITENAVESKGVDGIHMVDSIPNPNHNPNPNKEKGVRGKNQDHPGFALPGWVPLEPWQAFDAMRRKSFKKPWTDYAKRNMISRLEKYCKSEPKLAADILDQSVRNGWMDVYPMKRDSMFMESGCGNLHAVDDRSYIGGVDSTNLGALDSWKLSKEKFGGKQ